MKHLISLQDLSSEEVQGLLDLSLRVKGQPEEFSRALERKTLLMIFEKPSLRTRVSFETAMTRMGGHGIYYDMSQSPLGAGKETVSDTVRTVSRYVDMIIARLYEHDKILEMAQWSDVPVINALTDFNHPCQILADLFTIHEHKGKLKGLSLAYLGDAHNNVTHSLLYGCSLMGIDIHIGCPQNRKFEPLVQVVRKARRNAEKWGSKVKITHDAEEAAEGVDVVYTDSWMSYHVPQEELNERIRCFTPYQVNANIMGLAESDAIFMNCLPAWRGYEQTADVIDGPQSVVFDQAENRLHVQKAVILELLENGNPEPAP